RVELEAAAKLQPGLGLVREAQNAEAAAGEGFEVGLVRLEVIDNVAGEGDASVRLNLLIVEGPRRHAGADNETVTAAEEYAAELSAQLDLLLLRCRRGRERQHAQNRDRQSGQSLHKDTS